MYQVFVHSFKSPTTKTIVKEHEKNPSIPLLWQLITNHCTHSTVIRSKTTALLTYIASAQLGDGTWRGTIENFLANFFEQVRQYNEISPTPFSTTQIMDFVDNSCKGFETLTAVRKTAEQTKSLAGGRDITIEEYKALLIAQAQELDLKTKPARNPRPRRNANVHEILFDDDPNPISIESNVHELDEFDADTDVSVLLAHKSEQRANNSRNQSNDQPRRARLDRETWYKLSMTNQEAWDKIDDAGKHTILTYAAKNPTRILQDAHKARNANGSVNVHEIEFDDNVPQEQPREVHNHENTAPSSQEQAKEVMDTVKKEFDINTMLSKPKKTVTVSQHEIFSRRSSFTPQYEVNVTEWNASTPPVEPNSFEDYLNMQQETVRQEAIAKHKSARAEAPSPPNPIHPTTKGAKHDKALRDLGVDTWDDYMETQSKAILPETITEEGEKQPVIDTRSSPRHSDVEHILQQIRPDHDSDHKELLALPHRYTRKDVEYLEEQLDLAELIITGHQELVDRHRQIVSLQKAELELLSVSKRLRDEEILLRSSQTIPPANSAQGARRVLDFADSGTQAVASIDPEKSTLAAPTYAHAVVAAATETTCATPPKSPPVRRDRENKGTRKPYSPSAPPSPPNTKIGTNDPAPPSPTVRISGKKTAPKKKSPVRQALNKTTSWIPVGQQRRRKNKNQSSSSDSDQPSNESTSTSKEADFGKAGS